MVINVLGDSITEGALASSIDKTFVAVLSDLLNCKVNNFGIGGTRIARQLAPYPDPRFDLFFGSRVKDMPDADLVVVFGGTNDYGHGDVPIGEKEDDTPDTFYGGLNYLISELLRKYDKDKLLFILPIYRVNEDDPLGDHYRDFVTLPLQGYRNIIAEVLQSNGIEYLDIKDKIGRPGENDLFGDGLHPNDKGHRLIAKILTDYIKDAK